jgi:hydroxymethylbilane synthase
VDAVILAHAGLARLGLTARITRVLPPETMLPAATQGIIGIVCRTGMPQMQQLLGVLNDGPTWSQALCERAFLGVLDGSCRTPIGALALPEPDGTLTLHGLLAAMDGSRVFRVRQTGPASDPEALGRAAARQILTAAGDDFVAALRG